MPYPTSSTSSAIGTRRIRLPESTSRTSPARGSHGRVTLPLARRLVAMSLPRPSAARHCTNSLMRMSGIRMENAMPPEIPPITTIIIGSSSAVIVATRDSTCAS
jgi:hypothetical protein